MVGWKACTSEKYLLECCEMGVTPRNFRQQLGDDDEEHVRQQVRSPPPGPQQASELGQRRPARVTAKVDLPDSTAARGGDDELSHENGLLACSTPYWAGSHLGSCQATVLLWKMLDHCRHHRRRRSHKLSITGTTRCTYSTHGARWLPRLVRDHPMAETVSRFHHVS